MSSDRMRPTSFPSTGWIGIEFLGGGWIEISVFRNDEWEIRKYLDYSVAEAVKRFYLEIRSD